MDKLAYQEAVLSDTDTAGRIASTPMSRLVTRNRAISRTTPEYVKRSPPAPSPPDRNVTQPASLQAALESMIHNLVGPPSPPIGTQPECAPHVLVGGEHSVRMDLSIEDEESDTIGAATQREQCELLMLSLYPDEVHTLLKICFKSRGQKKLD